MSVNRQTRQFSGVDLDEIIKDFTEVPHVTLLKGENRLIINKIHYDHLKVNTSDTTYTKESTKELPTERVLFETTLKPNASSISLTFNVNRKSTTTAEIDVYSGHLIGEKVEVPFEVPHSITDQVRGNGGFTKQIVLNQTHSTKETSHMSWNLSASVTASEDTPLKFQVLLEEKEYDADFKAKTYVSGKIRVDYVSDKGRQVWLQPKSIGEIIHYLKRNPQLVRETTKAMLERVDVEGQNVVLTMKGHCHFKYGIQTVVQTKDIQ